MALKGIDTSSWQAGLDDTHINADFIIFKATEGVGYTDADCNASYQEAKKAGKLLGVYHFARPDGNSAVAEAQWFLSQVQGYIGEAILVLDWETEPKGNVTWAKLWLDTVYKATGVRPMIYMSESVVNAYNWSSVVAGDYGLWVAKYRDNTPDYNYNMTNAGTEPVCKWWSFYAMWQWTSSGRLDGWSGNLDCNEFYGDANIWRLYAGAKPVVIPPIIVPPVVIPPTITTKTESVTTVVPFTKLSIEDATKTGTKITTVGVNGSRIVTYLITLTDGKETSRTVTMDVTNTPIDEVTTIGTYVPPVTPPIMPPVVIPPVETIWQRIWTWIINFIKGVKSW